MQSTANAPQQDVRICAKCGDTYPLDHFTKDCRRADGRKTYCRACCTAAAAVWRSNNRERNKGNNRRHYEGNRALIAAQQKQRYHADVQGHRDRKREQRRRKPLLPLLSHARTRAKKRGLAFDITEDDLILHETCPVLGIPLIYGATAACDNSPSIDRRCNTEGYIRGNVEIISLRANRLKRDATPAELQALAAYFSPST